MISLFRLARERKAKVTPEVYTVPLAPEPVATVTMPGVDFNIPLIVEEHAPTRLKEIADELAAAHARIQKLENEAAVLNRLLKALTP